MSIKKLFDSNKTNDILVSTNLEEEVVKNVPELESADNVREQIERINRFIPQVDYSDPANFAVYGSAERYYRDSFHRIATQYPYDGSEEEITRYNNESNYLDLHILENEYPRTLGHVRFPSNNAGPAAINQFGQQTNAANITFFGGPNAIAGGMTTGSFHLQFTGSNYYDTDIYQTDGTLALDRVGSRESNLTYNLPSKGLTVEFWQGTEGNLISATGPFARQSRHALFDLWNGEASSSAQYGRLTVYASGSSSAFKGIYLNAYSGTVGIQELKLLDPAVAAQIPPQYVDTSSTTPGHLAFAFSSGSTLGLTVKTYINGALTTTTGSSIALNEVTGALRGRIGALLTNPSGTSVGTDMDGYGTSIRCAYDEFRYWKAERTEKEIQQNYWTQVRGGTNNEIANAELGVYYKFNEGITGDATTDTTVLDYSGRITNGTITNYGTDATTTLVRNANLLPERSSLIVAAGAATSEFKDPIIYASHPDVVSALDRLVASGSVHDFENQASIKDSIPSWIIEEDETSGGEELGKLTQILGSYMDTLNLQIESLPTLADNTYLSGSDKPTPFMKNLLSSRGLAVPEIFVDADLLQRFANRSDTEGYTLDINDTKNLIYKNIYNNLIYLYKSKGTEKAFRNLIRCYGIGEDVIRFNAYASNQTFDIQETRQDRVIRKNYVDFNHPDRFGGVVYQNSSSIAGNATYFSASSTDPGANEPPPLFAETAELEVIFPRKFEFSNSQYFDTPFVTASLFGRVTAASNPSTIEAEFNPADSQYYAVYAIRTHQNSKDAYFALDAGTYFNTLLTSSVYSNVYDNQKWNFAVRIKHKNWPYSTGSVDAGDTFETGKDDLDVSLVGYNVENGVVRNEFVLSTSSINPTNSEGDALSPSSAQRFYVGAQRTNYTGALVKQTDILASSLRVFETHLDTDVIKSHALDPENYGTRNPNRNFLFYNDSALPDLNPAIGQSIPESVSLALNWDYSQVTGTDASGEFTVEDASSGSTGLASRYPQENVLKNVNKQFAGRGFFPSDVSSTNVISKQFVQSAQQRLPEVVNTNDDVNVLSRDDELYPRDASISQTYYTFEKSMYGIVSQEMINMFSSIVEFNNLIGEVVHKYRGEYKSLRLLRELFFEKIQNNPDLDKFIDYYHWIDSSLNIFLQQFAPASADVSDEIRTIVEDYVLNRSKYQHKYNQIKKGDSGRFDETPLEGRVKGIRELEYDWQFGHAPLMTKAVATTECQSSSNGDYNNDTVTFTDGAGKTIVYKYTNDAGGVATGGLNTDGSVSIKVNGLAANVGSKAAELATAFNGVNGHGTSGLNTISCVTTDLTNGINTYTQLIAGTTGNNVTPSSDSARTEVTQEFSGGTGGQSEHSIWWKERAGRNTNVASSAPGGASSTINRLRKDLNDIILSFNSGSAPSLNDGTGASGVYEGSAYATRRFTRQYKLDTAIIPDIGGGYNYPRGHKPDGIFPLVAGLDSNTAFWQAENKAVPDIAKEELRPVMKQEKRKVAGIHTTTQVTNISNALGAADGTKYITPFVPFSSSVSPASGYGQSMQTGDDNRIVLSAEEAAGYHNDSYGDDYEVPMQGPFTNQHVGGNRHRHTDLNEGSDLMNNRAEAWTLAYAGARSMFDYATTTRGPSTHPNYRRDQTAKRPVNIKNIKHRTGSLGTVAMGNYSASYEIVQTTGRTQNNSAFVKSEGIRDNFTISVAGADEVGYIDHVTDYAKPIRRRTEHVIVNRFSAPGGPETAGDNQGGPGLDFEAAEFSPYNNLNYRNTTVRDPLRTLLTDHAAFGGVESGSAVSALNYTDVTASFHKVNRNTLRRLEGYSNNNETPTTGAVFDNFFVQHMIPQSDFQYSWITASTDRFNAELGAANNIYGYFPYDGLARVSSSANGFRYEAAVNFASASEVGSANPSATPATRQPKVSTSTGLESNSFVPTDFAGINSNVIEPISASDFTTGYPLELDSINYYNFGAFGAFPGYATAVAGGFITRINDNSFTRSGVLPHLIAHRGGNAGHPTWKQIRVGETQLARHYRKNNLYTHTYKPVIVSSVADLSGTRQKISSTTESIILTQSVVTDRYYPVIFEVEGRDDEQNSKVLKSSNFVVRASFVNDTVTFDDNEMVNRLVDANVIGNSSRKSSYKQIIDDFSIYDSFLDEQKPILQINSLKYRETVFPSQLHAYTRKVRGRTNYENNFWRDVRTDRTTKGESKKTINSQGFAVNQSAWALDGFESTENYPAATQTPYLTGGIEANNAAGYKPGELQNMYTHLVQSGSGDSISTHEFDKLRSGALYSRKHIMAFTSSIVGMAGMRKQIEIFTPTIASQKALIATSSIGAGEAFWDAARLAGKYEGTSSIFTLSERKPFYDDYDKFFADIKGKTRNKGIIPEFRITDHLDFYQNAGNDFLVDNEKLFSIVGTPSASAVPSNSSEDEFFTTFTNSDFMKYFEVIREDTNKEGGILEPSNIKIRCKAIKKFVPYDGFYPAERTLELAKQLSASIGPLTNLEGTDATKDVALRTIFKPFFAPGILYNTIKSGVAVDYPIMTGSYNKATLINNDSAATIRMLTTASAGIFSNSRQVSKDPALAGEISHNDGWDTRIPFEALLEPSKFIYAKNIVDDEPSEFAGIDCTASWGSSEVSNRYKNMMHNFLASSLDFFVKDGKPTEIVSAPESEFKSMAPGQPYGMRIKMYRSFTTGSQNPNFGDWGNFGVPQYISGSLSNFTMYSRPTAFGPPVAGGTGSFVSGDYPYTVTGSREATPARGRYMSHTPPYFDGESWIDLIYYPFKSYSTGTAGLLPEANMPRKITINELHTIATTDFASGSNLFTVTPGSGVGTITLNDSCRIGGEGTYVMRWRFDKEALKKDIAVGSTYNLTGSDMGPMSGPWANIWAMHLDASLNLFTKARGAGSLAAEAVSADLASLGATGPTVPQDDRWRIQTKFETPMLNFKYLANSDITVNGTLGSLNDTEKSINSVIPRGMWHQFGRIPREGEGVYIQVTDIPDDFLDNHPSSSVVFDPGGLFDSRNAVSRLLELNSVSKNLAGGIAADSANINNAIAKDLNGYKIPQNATIPAECFSAAPNRTPVPTTPKPLSLVDICGFPTEPVRIGEIEQTKTIFEAIVAVPFVIKEGEREFFNIESPTVSVPTLGRVPSENFKEFAGKSIKRQVELMEKYIFPPTFDFVTNPTVDPISMYVFEFSHKLTQDDLSHIWQNLSPEVGIRAESTMATVSHPLLANQLLNYKKASIENAIEDGEKIPRVEFPEELQWMVFKVKQRAKTDYYKQIGSEQRASVPAYTDNWPYDFFSLIEVADIDTEVTFKPTQNNLDMKTQRREASQEALNDRTSRKAAVDIGPAGD
jgi:hypothetical protein